MTWDSCPIRLQLSNWDFMIFQWEYMHVYMVIHKCVYIYIYTCIYIYTYVKAWVCSAFSIFTLFPGKILWWGLQMNSEMLWIKTSSSLTLLGHNKNSANIGRTPWVWWRGPGHRAQKNSATERPSFRWGCWANVVDRSSWAEKISQDFNTMFHRVYPPQKSQRLL